MKLSKTTKLKIW